MKSMLIALSLAALSFGAAASEYTRFYEAETFVSTRSRAEVRAEALAARARTPHFGGGEASLYWSEPTPSTKTRAQVIAELREARANGYSPFYGEAMTQARYF